MAWKYVNWHTNCVHRYSSVSRDNCLLCDRPYNLLDFYADLEPDRDYDIYSMSDDPKICKKEPNPERETNARKCCGVVKININEIIILISFPTL